MISFCNFLEKLRKIANPEGGFLATRDLSRGTTKKCARPIAHHISFHRTVIAKPPWQKNGTAGRITPLPCAAFFSCRLRDLHRHRYSLQLLIVCGSRNFRLECFNAVRSEQV